MKKPGREDKIAVVVGTITDDTRIFEIPKLKVSLDAGFQRRWFDSRTFLVFSRALSMSAGQGHILQVVGEGVSCCRLTV